jgi:SPP1 gp7 family putative phage head morphogenesis protein
MRRTHDRRASRQERADFSRARRAEGQYGVQLRRLARYIGQVVRSFSPTDWKDVLSLRHLLEKYAETVEPWARAVATRMVTEVARRDESTWEQVAQQMGTSLAREIRSAPTGERMRQLVEEQVGLIKSLPLEAAQRVQELAIRAQSGGDRPADIEKEILRTGEVTESRARLIARTEVGRAATALTQARAEHVGSDGYIWRTAHDADVRHSHRKMEGQFVRWDSPPMLDGMTGHAGCLPNCRCWCEPVIPR